LLYITTAYTVLLLSFCAGFAVSRKPFNAQNADFVVG